MTRGRLAAGMACALVALACAAVVHEGTAATGTEVLPDLVADAPASPVLQTYSHPDQTNHLLLRFEGYLHNRGSGAVEVRGSGPAGGRMSATVQRVYRSDGTSTDDASRNIQMVWEPQDGHLQDRGAGLHRRARQPQRPEHRPGNADQHKQRLGRLQPIYRALVISRGVIPSEAEESRMFARSATNKMGQRHIVAGDLHVGDRFDRDRDAFLGVRPLNAQRDRHDVQREAQRTEDRQHNKDGDRRGDDWNQRGGEISQE